MSVFENSLVDTWIRIASNCNNDYLGDFLVAHCIDGSVYYTIPRDVVRVFEIFMIDRYSVENYIHKYSNDDSLYYRNYDFDTHNPYNEVARYLYLSCKNKKEYLLAWLYWLINNDHEILQCCVDNDYFATTIEIKKYFNSIGMEFYVNGNAKNLLPKPSGFYYDDSKDIKDVLNYYKYQMDYIKSNYYMIILSDAPVI